MAARVYPLDWREEFAQLGPYLDGEGGVVRIRYAGERCAPSAFLDTLKPEYEDKDDNSKWRSIQIDHKVYSVRYLSGIRDEFVRKIGMNLPEALAINAAPASFTVFADVQAGGDVNADLSNITQIVNLNGNDAALMSAYRGRRIAFLCAEIENFLESGHMMVVLNHGSLDDQDEFWRYLWEDGLENLVDAGLLLVHMFDVSDETAGLHNLAPNAHLEMDLPTALGVQARHHAIDDLVNIIMRFCPRMPMDQARGAAHALVTTHVDDIPRLHRRCAGYLMELGREFG